MNAEQYEKSRAAVSRRAGAAARRALGLPSHRLCSGRGACATRWNHCSPPTSRRATSRRCRRWTWPPDGSRARRKRRAVTGRIGAYDVLSLIGRGGMGEVYLAHDTRLGRNVAVKLLRPGLTSNRDAVRRFEQEARAASSLNHPNIVTIYEIGDMLERRFIAMELVEGQSLAVMVRRPLGRHRAGTHRRAARAGAVGDARGGPRPSRHQARERHRSRRRLREGARLRPGPPRGAANRHQRARHRAPIPT